MKRIYLSGPMTGIPGLIAAFHAMNTMKTARPTAGGGR